MKRKTKLVIVRISSILAKIMFLGMLVFLVLNCVTDKSYIIYFGICLALMSIFCVLAFGIDTRTPEEKERDAIIDKERKEQEEREELDRQGRRLEANQEYGGDLCQTCNTPKGLCDQCGHYEQWS